MGWSVRVSDAVSPPMLPDPNERGRGCTHHTHTLRVQSRAEVTTIVRNPLGTHSYTETVSYLATQQPATAATSHTVNGTDCFHSHTGNINDCYYSHTV